MSEEHQITLFFEAFVLPKKQKNTAKYTQRPSEVKILLTLYQMNKNVQNKKWYKMFPSRQTIATSAGICPRSVCSFVNSSTYQLFGEVEHRPGTSSVYRLNPVLTRLLRFMERTGLMSLFRKDYTRWLKQVRNRFNKWLLPLLERGFSLEKILMNKLSTKSGLELRDPPHLKLRDPLIQPPGASFMEPSERGSKSKYESPPPWLTSFMNVYGTLSTDFQLQEGDIHYFFATYGLKKLKKGIRRTQEWLKRGLQPHSMVKVLQKNISA